MSETGTVGANPAPNASADLDAISRLIRTRRTLKPAAMDPGRSVDRGLLERLLENANWAPTHGATEPWRFHVFAGDSRQQLAAELQRAYRERTPPDAFRPEKFEKLGANPLLAGVVLVICMKRQESGKIPEIEEIEAVACAVQNLHLTASAAGLGAQWSSPPFLYEGALHPFLQLGERDRCLGLFYLGWPKAGIPWPQGSRRPASDKTIWHP